jgi:hypothetical protein
MGVWAYGRMGVWAYGRMGVWAFRRLGVWAWRRLPWRDIRGVPPDGTHVTYGTYGLGLMSPMGPIRCSVHSTALKKQVIS